MFPDEPQEQPHINEADLAIQEAIEKARVESTQLELYANEVFGKTHPRPVPPVLTDYVWQEFDMEGVSFLEERGVEAWVNASATVGGILFSAIRTAGIFAVAESRLLATYNVHQTINTTLSWIAGFSLVTIIEGVLAGFGWIRGKKSGSINTSWTPIVIAGAIAALAGVLPAFELFPESAGKDWWELRILILLVLMSGPGIGYLIYVVTENYGHLHNAWEVDVQQRIDDHNKEQARRQKEHYDNQDTLMRIHQQAEAAWFEMLQDDYRRRGRSLLFGGESFVVKRQSHSNGKTPTAQQSKGLKALVLEYLSEHGITSDQVGEGDGFVVTPLQIAKEKNILKPDGSLNNSGVRVTISRLNRT